MRFCPRGSVRWYVTERARFSQRRITRNYALPAVNSCERAGNSGILCETRREVLPARERTLVRDRMGMVLATTYHAKLRIILLNCEKPCRARREVLHARERTSVRDRTGMVLATPYRAKIRIYDCQFLRKVGNSGILCETRREVLRTRERTSVRGRTGMVLATPSRAKLRIAGCQFLRKGRQ